MFQDITEGDILLVQEYVSNELPDHLDALLTECQLAYTHKEKICFFGSYATVPSKFCFAPGEKLMILKMVRHVKEIVADQGLQHYADETIVPKKNRNEINMFNSVFGLIYGFQEKPKIEKVNDPIIDTTHHQTVLFGKAKTLFTQFQRKKLQPTHAFTLNMVEIKAEGDKIKGKVQCILCEGSNSISVFCKSTGYWVLTNLNSHMNHQHVKHEDELSKRCEKLTMENESAANDGVSADFVDTDGKFHL